MSWTGHSVIAVPVPALEPFVRDRTAHHDPSFADRTPWTVSFAAAREARLDLLGDLVKEHLDVGALLGLACDGAPGDLPVVPPAELGHEDVR